MAAGTKNPKRQTERQPAFVLTVEEDAPRPLEVLSSTGWSPAAGTHRVRIEASKDDTSGQSLAGAATLEVIVYGDDTEGQSMTLRFPSPADAVEFQRKLIIAGALAGTIVAGTIGATALSSAASTTAPSQVTAGAAAMHDSEKLSTVPLRDTDKLEVAVPRAGNTTPDISRIAESSSTIVPSEIGREYQVRSEAARAQSEAIAESLAAQTGAEAQAKAAAAKAGGPSLGGGSGASDESVRLNPAGRFRGR